MYVLIAAVITVSAINNADLLWKIFNTKYGVAMPLAEP